jgi:Family of unknown function (DUF5335)
MQTVKIARKEWIRALNEFTRVHEGRLVSLDILAESIGAQPEFHELPLIGLTAEPSEGGSISIAVGRSAGDHLTHTIHSPTQVSIEQTEAGATVAIEIKSADGTTAILRFRTVGLPEIVDGVARSQG